MRSPAQTQTTHRWAFGFNPAVCCIFRVNCPCKSCSRLKTASSTGVRVDRDPSVNPADRVRYTIDADRIRASPDTNFAWGTSCSSFVRRAIMMVERHSLWPWNSVWHNKCWPPRDSGSVNENSHVTVSSCHDRNSPEGSYANSLRTPSSSSLAMAKSPPAKKKSTVVACLFRTSLASVTSLYGSSYKTLVHKRNIE